MTASRGTGESAKVLFLHQSYLEAYTGKVHFESEREAKSSRAGAVLDSAGIRGSAFRRRG